MVVKTTLLEDCKSGSCWLLLFPSGILSFSF